MIRDDYYQPVEYNSKIYSSDYDEYGHPKKSLEFSSINTSKDHNIKKPPVSESVKKSSKLLKSQIAAMLTTSTLVIAGIAGSATIIENADDKQQICSFCEGSGFVENTETTETEKEPCPQCDGTGFLKNLK